MKNKLLNEFKQICKINDNIIREEKNVIPMAFIFRKNLTADMIPLKFENHNQKELLRTILLQHIAKIPELEGYITVMDSKATIINKITNKTEVSDCVVRSLYTKKTIRQEIVFYKDNKIIKKEMIQKRRNKNNSNLWDLWNISSGDQDAQTKYNTFKENNPGLYKDTLK